MNSMCLSSKRMGSAWQEAVLKLNEVQHVEAYNAAIAACGKAHKWQLSLDLLHKLHQTHLKATIVSFNAAISACERVSLWRQSLKLLSTLQNERLQESVVTYLTSISACGKGTQWQSAIHLLEDAERNNADAVEVYNATISAYQRSKLWERALDLFFRMNEMNLSDVISLNAALSACSSESGLWQAALHLISGMQAFRIWANEVAHNSGITSCAKSNSWDKALNLFRLLESNGRKLDVISYGAATNACDRGARWQHAIYLKDIAGADQSDKSLSYFATSCVGASSRLGRWECAMQIYRQLRANCCELSIISCTALCTADGRRWQDALYMASGPSPVSCDVDFYNEVMGATEWANALLLLLVHRKTLQMNSVSYNAVMGSCQRWEHWQESLTLFLDQSFRGIRLDLSSLGSAMSVKSQWEGVSTLLQRVQDLSLESGSAGSAGSAFKSAALFSSGNWKNSLSVLQGSRLLVDRISDFRQLLDAYSEAQWPLACLLLLQLEGMRIEATTLSFALASAIAKKGIWSKALEISNQLWHRAAVSVSTVVTVMLNSFSAGLQWQKAVSALRRLHEPQLLDYDILVTTCWNCEENQMAGKLFKESGYLRSAVSFLWGLSVVHEQDPTVIHSACVNAWVAMKQTIPSDFDLITAWKSSAVLGVGNPAFHKFLEEQVLHRLSSFPLEQLSFAVQAAASTTASAEFFSFAQERALYFLREGLLDLSFFRDGQELLSMIFACKVATGGEISSLISSKFLNTLRAALRQHGQSMDGRKKHNISSKLRVLNENVSEVQVVMTMIGGDDRPVLLKPPGWEVYNDRVEACPQLLSYVRRVLRPCRIHQDMPLFRKSFLDHRII